MMAMETVDLGDVNTHSIAHQLNDSNDQPPITLEQIQIEESEERWRNE
jgi:hypothetical protein